MKEDNRLVLLKTYINSNFSPVLLENASSSLFQDNATIIKSTMDISELNGHYEELDFVPPYWYQDLVNNNRQFLVIDKISEIPKSEQKKFIEILKYRKVSVFDIPKSVVIVLISSELNNNIDEEILSLVAVI